ncbi:MAG: penicillin-binding protein [Bacteroidetes bacterium]|jgi:penicillin-binding protein 1A|nr:penicillin-binding protein [Bacteroidota bacterium]
MSWLPDHLRYRLLDLRYDLRDWRPGWRTVVVGLVAGLAFAVIITLGRLYAAQPVPDLDALRAGQDPSLGLATVVYTADGAELMRYYRQNRTWTTHRQLGPAVVDALIATEDHRFYRHHGIDLIRLVSSVWHTLRGDRQGGSTITMQLARNLFTDIREAPLLERKVREWVAALKIERAYEKPQILEMYLNTVPFGYEAFGIEAAARTYFDARAARLTEPQAATLVGMLKATTYYNPVRNPENARQRRDVVLGQMARREVLDGALDSLRALPLGLDFERRTLASSLAPHFADYVREQLDDWAARRGIDPRMAGLRVHTTLDSHLQLHAQQAVEAQMQGLQAVAAYEWSQARTPSLGEVPARYVRRLQTTTTEPFAHFWRTHPSLLTEALRRTRRYRRAVARGTPPDSALLRLQRDPDVVDSVQTALTRLETGLVALDPATGAVRVWVGGRDFLADQYDHVALARRQPGSTFKPFIYAAALERGWDPDDELRDVVRTYALDDSDETWAPRNVSGASGEMLTLRDALARSKNTITAQLIADLGPEYVAHLARRMGIRSPLEQVPSLALGTSDVTLLELVAAYTPFVREGAHLAPYVITHIEDRNGQRLATFQPQQRPALPRYTAYEVLDMLRDVVDRGTGVRIRHQFGIAGDLAGKTGTTQNNADGWFILLHPQLVTGAWVGFNDRRVTFRSDWWGQGAHNALFVTGDFYRRLQRAGLLSPNARFATPRSRRPGLALRTEAASDDTLASDSLWADSTAADSLRRAPRPRDAEHTLRAAMLRQADRERARAAADTSQPADTIRTADTTQTAPPPQPDAADRPASEADVERAMRELLQDFTPTKDTTDTRP